MNAKRGLLRNMIERSKASRHLSKRQKIEKNNFISELPYTPRQVNMERKRMSTLQQPSFTSTFLENTRYLFWSSLIKARCHTRFQRAFAACCCVFKEITFIGSNQRNYFEHANACSKRTSKTRMATRLNLIRLFNVIPMICHLLISRWNFKKLCLTREFQQTLSCKQTSQAISKSPILH